MTYKVLHKATKKEIIDWLRKNVFLPNISDEEFLRQVKLNTLLEEEKKLISAQETATHHLEEAKDNPIRFMQVMVELQKISDQMCSLDKKIAALISSPKEVCHSVDEETG